MCWGGAAAGLRRCTGDGCVDALQPASCCTFGKAMCMAIAVL
jgi:hypothetical protein